MLYRTIASFVILISTVCHAQLSFRTQIAALVLAEQSAINPTIDCREYLDDVIPNAVGVRIFSNYTPNACYDLATIFSPDHYDNTTLFPTVDGIVQSCDPYFANCMSDYQALGLTYYDPSANYTQTLVELYQTSVGSTIGPITLKTFAKDKCEEDAAEPWFSWGGCNRDLPVSHCRELPYSVRSFRLEQTASENVGRCMLAVERGAGVKVTNAGFATVGGLIITGIMSLM